MEQLSSTSKCQNYFSCFFSPCSLNFVVEALIFCFLILSLLEAVIPCTDIVLCFPYCSRGILTLGAGGSWP